MGTITITNSQIESGSVAFDRLIGYAGGTQTDIDAANYDYAAETFSVPGIDTVTLQNALDNYDTKIAEDELANIAAIKDQQYKRIDDAAGAKRDEYITVAAGQEMTYIRKAEDAQKYIDDGYPVDSTPYPWVDAEATATGATATDVANNIVAQNTAWVSIGTTIEGLRMGGKYAILNATTVTDVRTIGDTTIANLEAL